MKKTHIVGTVGAAVVVALGGALPAVANSTSAVSVEDLIPALAAPQVESDRAPEGMDLAALGGIEPDSLRALGGDDAGDYWVGRAGGAEVCLVTRLAVDPDLAASTCAPITDFYRSGLSLVAAISADDPTLAAEAYLLPADINLTSHDQASARQAAVDPQPNLISGRSDQLETLEAFEVERTNGASFRFMPIALEGGER